MRRLPPRPCVVPEGKHEVARHLLAGFRRAVEEVPTLICMLEHVPGVMRSAIACNGGELASDLAERIAALAPAHRFPLDQAVVIAVSALADELHGVVRAAALSHAEAAAAWQGLSMPYEEAQASSGRVVA